ncbi:DNA replication licensing factor MCM6, partial [Giardia duodenalis]
VVAQAKFRRLMRRVQSRVKCRQTCISIKMDISGGRSAQELRDEHIQLFVEFFNTYTGSPDIEPDVSTAVYLRRMRQMIDDDSNTLYINFNHLYNNVRTQAYCEAVRKQFYVFEPFIIEAIRIVLNTTLASYRGAAFQVLTSGQRQVLRPLYISCYGMNSTLLLSELTSSHIGQLVELIGTVTRTSDVQPELILGTFRCASCGEVIPNIAQEYKFTEPASCPRCSARSGVGGTTFELMTDQCIFVDTQRIRLQESIADTAASGEGGDPTRITPASYDVVLRGTFAGVLKPGDRITLTGCLIVQPNISAMSMPYEIRSSSLKSVIAGYSIESGNMTSAAVQDNIQRGRHEEGVTGITGVGLREITYKSIIIGSHVYCKMNKDMFGSIPEGADQPEASDGHIDNDPMDYNAHKPSFLVAFEEQLAKDSEEAANEDVEQTLATMIDSLSDEYREAVSEMRNDPNIISNLVASFAPHIYGHETIKLGILLQLLGGIKKITRLENLSIRSDINILLIGDPSTAKSQLLQYTADFHQKAVYTSGKSSTAAGLTAAVVTDPETGEYTVEAGALIRADGGLCLIDEFEKISVTDQTALHECLEQQSVSINKAGISITLKAKTPVLAAMNPIGSRYQRNKSLKNNINISQPILSRFDLAFVLLDEPNKDVDNFVASRIITMQILRNTAYQYAKEVNPENDPSQSVNVDRLTEEEKYAMGYCQHVGNLLNLGGEPQVPYPFKIIQLYLSLGRTIRPILQKDAIDEISYQWVELRRKDMGATSRSFRITVRQLESLVRLSEAFARLCLATAITKEHVKKAAELVSTTCVNVADQIIKFQVEVLNDGRVQLDNVLNRPQTGTQDQDGSDDLSDEGITDARERRSERTADHSQTSGNVLTVDLSYNTLVAMCQSMRYIMAAEGHSRLTYDTSINLLVLNLPLDATLTEPERRAIAKVVFDKMVMEYRWLLEDVPGEYVFTHLAPTFGVQ